VGSEQWQAGKAWKGKVQQRVCWKGGKEEARVGQVQVERQAGGVKNPGAGENGGRQKQAQPREWQVGGRGTVPNAVNGKASATVKNGRR